MGAQRPRRSGPRVCTERACCLLTGCRAAQAELPSSGFPDLGCELGGDYGASALGCAPPEHSGAAEVPDIARLGGRAGSLLSACEARVPSVVMAALVTDARPLHALRRTNPHAPLVVCDDDGSRTRTGCRSSAALCARSKRR